MSNKLAGSKKVQYNNSSLEIARACLEYAVVVWGIALAVLVPLYLKDGYHGVGDCKYELYKWLMIIGVVVLAFLLLLYFCQGGLVPYTDKISGTATKTANKLLPTDIFVLAFLGFAILAAVVGGNFSACIKGYNGWYMGILSMFSFAILYFFFAKASRYANAVIAALLGTSFITYIIGILHRLMIDVIGTYYLGTDMEIADNYKNQFLSTLGQASWYSSFVCTIFPLGVAIFWFAKHKAMRIAFGVFTLVGSMTLVTQNSDSAYLAMLGFFFVFFWFSAKDAFRMERFMEVLVLFFMGTRMMNLLFLIHPNPALDLDAFSSFIVFSPMMWLITVLVVVLWAVSLLFTNGILIGKYPKAIMGVVRVVFLACIVLAIIAATAILVMCAKGTLPAGLLSITEKIPYMTWSDNWGNGRGRTWAFSIQMYKGMDFGHKLFGVGPDGYAPYAYKLYSSRLEEMWGSRTLTNAHNEWLNALINFGLFGAIAYIGIFVSACRQFVKVQMEKPIVVGFMACIVSYICHNLFCYQTVCCTPYIFMLMGIGVYISNNSYLQKRL